MYCKEFFSPLYKIVVCPIEQSHLRVRFCWTILYLYTVYMSIHIKHGALGCVIGVFTKPRSWLFRITHQHRSGNDVSAELTVGHNANIPFMIMKWKLLPAENNT